MAKEGVIKRRFIGQDIINELNAKYPPQCEANGVVYKTDLKYITFEPDDDIDATIVAFDVQIGFGVFNVIFYFAEEMMKDGYRVRVDGQNMQRHTFICQGKYGVPAEKVQQIVDYLISCNYFFLISDGTYTYLTTCQAVYDYERCMNTRIENRKRKQKSREKYKQLEQAKNTPQPTQAYLPQHQAQICCNQGYEYPANGYKEDEEHDDFGRMIQEEEEYRQQHGMNCDYDDYDEPDEIDIMIQEETAIRQQKLTNPNYNEYCNNINSFDDCPF